MNLWIIKITRFFSVQSQILKSNISISNRQFYVLFFMFFMYIYFLVSWIFQKEIRHKKRWEFVFCWWHFPILCVVESYLAEPNYRKRSQNPQIPIIWGSKLCGKLCSDFIIRFVSLCYSCSIISACHEIDSTILQNKHSRNILWNWHIFGAMEALK